MFLQSNVTAQPIILLKPLAIGIDCVRKFWNAWVGNFIVFGQQIGSEISMSKRIDFWMRRKRHWKIVLQMLILPI